MYARVVTWEGGDAEAIRANAIRLKEQVAQGPPVGVPAKGVRLLIDPEGGKTMIVVLFATEEDRAEGHATLNKMTPLGDIGTRTGIGFYEQAVSADV